jgi:Glycerophosphoryl diester phosphodiesterase family
MKIEKFYHRLFASAAFSAVAFALLSIIAWVHAAEPLENAHSHNDYWRARPLTDALDRGFGSVEADVFLVDGALLVGHAREELATGKTLESLYLAPLAARVRENGGTVHPGGKRFYLLIDIKSDAAATYASLREVLSKYAEMLTTVENGKLRPGAVTVVISGNRPKIDANDAGPRYAGLDGRTSDLASDVPAHLMPMISDNWTIHFRWTGNGPMLESERARLREIVTKAHAAGRVVRFWATPESEQVWHELRSAGVDLINTDQLDRLATFLRGS